MLTVVFLLRYCGCCGRWSVDDYAVVAVCLVLSLCWIGTQAVAALTAKDYQQMTLTMHAAAAGNSAAFQEVVKAVDSQLSDAEVGA